TTRLTPTAVSSFFSGDKSSGVRHYEFVVTGPEERRSASCMMPRLSLPLTLLVPLAQTPLR
ncbi:hypothetical protein GALMADRAFT_258957, partial [Galerina marginata CBS 339.88]